MKLKSKEAKQIAANRAEQYAFTGKVQGVGYHTKFKSHVGAKIADGIREDFTLAPEINTFVLELLKAGITRSTLGNWVSKFTANNIFFISYGDAPKTLVTPARTAKEAGGSKYKRKLDGYAARVSSWISQGMSKKAIAMKLEVSEPTLYSAIKAWGM